MTETVKADDDEKKKKSCECGKPNLTQRSYR